MDTEGSSYLILERQYPTEILRKPQGLPGKVCEELGIPNFPLGFISRPNPITLGKTAAGFIAVAAMTNVVAVVQTRKYVGVDFASFSKVIATYFCQSRTARYSIPLKSTWYKKKIAQIL